MASIITKAIGIWLLIVAAAILNGLIRDTVLTYIIGSAGALPLSGITLSLLILLITWLLVPILGRHRGIVFMSVGLLWVLLTLSFEYLFGHFVLAKPWNEINAVFNVMDGNLFVVALITAAAAPWWAAKLRGMLDMGNRRA